jgi:hypothetical protein
MSAPYASPMIRDQFLTALDADNRALFTQLALNLVECSNPLPGMTCEQLGLPIGSTYGSAAQHVLLLHAAPSSTPAPTLTATIASPAPSSHDKPLHED